MNLLHPLDGIETAEHGIKLSFYLIYHKCCIMSIKGKRKLPQRGKLSWNHTRIVTWSLDSLPCLVPVLLSGFKLCLYLKKNCKKIFWNNFHIPIIKDWTEKRLFVSHYLPSCKERWKKYLLPKYIRYTHENVNGLIVAVNTEKCYIKIISFLMFWCQ